MKAVSYEGNRTMTVADHPKPKLKSPTGAILRVTTSGICGSDLHMYDGRTALDKGTVVGHEIMGVIEQVGEAVSSIKRGDRVVLPFNISCGFCYNCHRGNTHACLTMNPEGASAAYGYAGMGPYSGGQAEFVLVPHADFNCLKLPGTPGDEWEDDFLLLADVFPTGYHATELACVSPGKTVAIFGSGPVGLMLMADFVTAVKYKLPIKVVIIKNNTLGQIKWEQMVFLGNPEYGVDLHPIDFAAFAHACGGIGFTVDDPADCGQAMEEFLAAPGPAVLQAVVDPFEPPMPAKVKAEQALHFAESLARGEPNTKKIALTAISDQIRELI